MKSLQRGTRQQSMSDISGKTVSLVLGSGGARGLAHVGIIRYLEEQDCDIRSIAGCSIGAVIGGIYAAGKLDEYEQWATAIDRFDIVSLMDFTWDGPGLMKGEKIIETLRGLVGDVNFEDLPIRLTVTAADIISGREVWIQSGNVFDGIRASMSLPLILTPVPYNDGLLIDGGVLNPVPIAPTFSDTTDLTIAVDLSGKSRRQAAPKRNVPVPAADDSEPEFHERIRAFIDKIQGGKKPSRKMNTDWSSYDIAYQAFDAMQGAIARQKLAAYPPDKTITIPRDACRTMEFDRAQEMIDLGYQSAVEQLAASDSGED